LHEAESYLNSLRKARGIVASYPTELSLKFYALCLSKTPIKLDLLPRSLLLNSVFIVRATLLAACMHKLIYANSRNAIHLHNSEATSFLNANW
jgi:hypothetical protein